MVNRVRGPRRSILGPPCVSPLNAACLASQAARKAEREQRRAAAETRIAALQELRDQRTQQIAAMRELQAQLDALR